MFFDKFLPESFSIRQVFCIFVVSLCNTASDYRLNEK